MAKSEVSDVEAFGCVVVLGMVFSTFVVALGIGCFAFLRWLWGMVFA